MKLFNNTVSVFVIAVVALIIIPLPTPLLDFMFVGNLTLSFIILLTTMYIRESLEFSIYPSILLITTLFRLALNISSTRSILTKDGYAGEVVKTFGEFVIQGNVVVGLVIFLIIVLVQFLVITKGSERVAEVSARFTLDAMPGKQMAIDADLSSGLIDEQEARTRRSKIQREADFFGAMDGATKFVKGDSIMSIVTTFINLIGGVIVGFINNVGSFSEIMSIYSTSTVGDGLMSQIPALLISVATGMIVTRSASEANLNEDISSQLFSQPRVLIMAGMAMLCTMFIGFPKAQVTTVSIAMIALGLILMRQSSVRQAAAAATDAGPVPMEEVTNEAAFYKNIDNVYNLLNVDQISMEFGYSLIPLVDEASGGSFVDRVVMFRKQFAQEMGMVFPSVRLKDSGQLNPNQYAISIKGEQVAQGEVLTDHYLALMPADGDDTVDGIETVEPAFGIPARWISEDKRVKAELAGYTLIDPTSVIITHLSEVVKAHAHELLNRQETNNMLANLRKSNGPGHRFGGQPPENPLQPPAGGRADPRYRDHPRDACRLRRNRQGYRHADRICPAVAAPDDHPPVLRGGPAQGHQPGREHRKPDHGFGQEGGERFLPRARPANHPGDYLVHHPRGRQDPRPRACADHPDFPDRAHLLQKAG